MKNADGFVKRDLVGLTALLRLYLKTRRIYDCDLSSEEIRALKQARKAWILKRIALIRKLRKMK